MSLLEVVGLVAGYGPHDEILKGVGISVEPHEMIALIGPNGAGKSTLLKVIAGFVRPRQGAISFDGGRIEGLRPREVSRSGIAFVPQEANVFPSLSVEENLAIGGYLARGSRSERIRSVFERFPLLAEQRSRQARTLSGGQRQILAVGMALMVSPRLILLDEPSAGLSPIASDELFALIKALHNEGMTIVLVEQNVREALRVADRAYLLVDGRNVREGRTRALAEDADIRHAFLGG